MPGTEIAPGVLNWASLLDDVTALQAARTARLGIIEGHIALMPDAHLGSGATIGSVIPTRTAIIPSAVGVDIGCGVIAALTTLTSDDLPDDLGPVLREFERRIPAGVGIGHDEVQDRAWNAFVRSHGEPPEGMKGKGKDGQRIRKKAPKQFGTLGSGNHFLEVCLDEKDQVWLMLHSGSRGPGNELAQRHIGIAKRLMKEHGIGLEDQDLAYLQQDWPEFDAYMRDLEWAQAFAFESRNVMMNIALQCLGRACKLAGNTKPSALAPSRNWINNHHNYTARETHFGQQVWITRKGAIRAGENELGVIPGSMGTGSFIVRGLGNPHSYMSASHGAGRAMSRGAARRQFTEEDMHKAMAGKVWLEDHAKKLIDEIPGSYKDLDTVMRDQHDLVEIVHRLTTLVNYKGTS